MSLLRSVLKKLGLVTESKQQWDKWVVESRPVEVEVLFSDVEVNMRVKYENRWWWKVSESEVVNLSQNFGNRTPMPLETKVIILVEPS